MPITPENELAIRRAAEHIRAGRLVAFPTETVYGLGADATNGLAVAAIYEAKGRPRFNPLIVHVLDRAQAESLAEMTPLAAQLADAFWPGPLTLVLRRRQPSPIADLVTAGLDTIAIRVPDHPMARRLLATAGCPLAAPSANRSGSVSPTRAQHVFADLGDRAAMILDGGPTAFGLESTVVDATGEEIVMLRPGAVPADQIEEIIGRPLARAFEGGAQPKSPGQLATHYSPRAAVRLGVTRVEPGEALLAFGADAPQTAGPAINLSPSGDLMEAAASLFAALRALDRPDVKTIAVMPIPEHGLGEAINDRLKHAAAAR